jgi:hypothetical protein
LVSGLLLSNLEDVRRFKDTLKHIALKKQRDSENNTIDFESIASILNSNLYNVKAELL